MMILSFFKRMIKRVFKYIKMILEGTTGLRRDWPEKKRIQYAMDLYEKTQGYRIMFLHSLRETHDFLIKKIQGIFEFLFKPVRPIASA